MISEFESVHATDSQGDPVGGSAFSKGVEIQWHSGPRSLCGENLPENGATVETLLAICKDRLEYQQRGKYACEENSVAIQNISSALAWLEARTKRI